MMNVDDLDKLLGSEQFRAAVVAIITENINDGGDVADEVRNIANDAINDTSYEVRSYLRVGTPLVTVST